MRHGISGNRLSRNSSLRKATMRDIAKATLIEERICTTEAKAKEARKLVDKLITLAKKGTLADKRRAFAVLCNHKLVSELFSDVAPRFKERKGGYSRIIHLGTRRGDNAKLVYLELTEKKEIIISKTKSKASSNKKGVTAGVGKDDALKKELKSSEKGVAKEGNNEQSQKKDNVKVEKKELEGRKKDKFFKKFSTIRKIFNKKSSGK